MRFDPKSFDAIMAAQRSLISASVHVASLEYAAGCDGRVQVRGTRGTPYADGIRRAIDMLREANGTMSSREAAAACNVPEHNLRSSIWQRRKAGEVIPVRTAKGKGMAA